MSKLYLDANGIETLKNELERLLTVEPARIVRRFPFEVDLGTIKIKGELGIGDPPEDSYIKGKISGAIDGEFLLNRDQTEIEIGNQNLSIELRVDFGDKKLEARICTLFGCTPWQTILVW